MSTTFAPSVERTKPLVLVVDDSAASRAQIKNYLETTQRYRVITATDGIDALAKVRTEAPAVIVSDLTMPRLDGRKLVAAIKDNPQTRHIHFILLTALDSASNAVDGLSAGADDYITKPFDGSVLCARVEAAARIAGLYAELSRRTHELERAKHDLEAEVAHRHRMEGELRLANKLEAIGQLASGVAHEINTPAQYVGDNLQFLSKALADLISFFGEQTLALLECGSANALDRMAERSRDLDIDYLLLEMPRALAQASDGVSQIARIVSAMKDFAHPGGADKVAVDFNHLVESTVTISRNQWKDVAEVALELAPDLEPIECCEGEIKQVLLNLLTNAAHAIADAREKTGSTTLGRIAIGTQQQGDTVHLFITDTGCGISERDGERIFDPFFTTKEVGRGTGQGLPIVRAVVVERHGGRVTFASKVGVGTSFHIWLPVRAESSDNAEGAAGLSGDGVHVGEQAGG